MVSIFPVPLVNLFACDRANTVTTRITAEGSTAFAHTPFGHRSPDTGEDNGAGFNGQYQERDGAYLLGHGYRAYRPALGRFTAPDSYSPFGSAGLNSYAYCRAEPVNRHDPSGHRDDNTLPWVAIGFGLFAIGLGVPLTRQYAMAGIGLAAGGALAAGMGALSMGSVNQGFKEGFAGAALGVIALGLVGGVVGGRMFRRAPKRASGNIKMGGVFPDTGTARIPRVTSPTALDSKPLGSERFATVNPTFSSQNEIVIPRAQLLEPPRLPVTPPQYELTNRRDYLPRVKAPSAGKGLSILDLIKTPGGQKFLRERHERKWGIRNS